MIRTPEYLQKGGRPGGAVALLGCLLQMQPILSLSDGQGTATHLMSCLCT